ncbi:MAG: UDP-N-acetylglucosamine 1-carboxyvinyltransferase [Candidatus Zipacnadales bacterium]
MTKQLYWDIEGGTRLNGVVHVRGGKNAAPKHAVASLLTDEPCILSNVPRVGDVKWTLDVLEALGTEVQWLDDHTVQLHTPHIRTPELPATYGGSSRLPVLLLGPLLARLGEARVPHGGGCQIGSRPVDYHVAGIRALGAELVMTEGQLAAKTKRLRGNTFELPYPSVGATETLLLAAVLAEGTTILKDIALEPEVLELIGLLHSMGAQLRFESDRILRIQGVKHLRGYTHRCVADRNECASWACAAIATDGDVIVRGAEQQALLALLDRLREIGADYEIQPGGIRFFRREKQLRGISVETSYHPGFMSDWQPLLAVVLTQAHGQSIIHETVYEDRFRYVEGLIQMGAEMTLRTECLGPQPCRHRDGGFKHSCVIHGPTALRATVLRMPDLRGGFAHAIAAMLADGTSRLFDVNHISRGYADFVGKARALGVHVTEGVAMDAQANGDMLTFANQA